MIHGFDGLALAAHTDIAGGVLQAAEDLKDGYVRDIPLDLDGFEVVALNVTKLRTDNIDPRDHVQRLGDWKARVEASGGRWTVINDLDRLDTAFLG